MSMPASAFTSRIVLPAGTFNVTQERASATSKARTVVDRVGVLEIFEMHRRFRPAAIRAIRRAASSIGPGPQR